MKAEWEQWSKTNLFSPDDPTGLLLRNENRVLLVTDVFRYLFHGDLLKRQPVIGAKVHTSGIEQLYEKTHVFQRIEEDIPIKVNLSYSVRHWQDMGNGAEA